MLLDVDIRNRTNLKKKQSI